MTNLSHTVPGSSTQFSRKVPKGMEKNLKLRRELLKRAAQSRTTRLDLMEMCAADRLFWVTTFVWAHAPKSATTFGTPVIPYIPFRYQEEAMATIGRAIGREDVHNEKSRQMGGTATCLQVMLHTALFNDYSSLLATSRNESMVDGSDKSLFSIIDFYMKWLPPWMVGERGVDYERKKLLFKFNHNGSALKGESTTENIGVGEDRLVALLDEYAKYEGGGWSVLGATADVTNCRIFNSTPEGQGNAYYEQRDKTKARVRMHWSRHPWKNKGLYRPPGGEGTTTKPVEAGVELLDAKHWDAYANGDGTFRHPLLDGELYEFNLSDTRATENSRSVWYDKECARRNEHDVATYLDIDYQGSDFPAFSASKIEALIEELCRPPRSRYYVRVHADKGEVILEPTAKGRLMVWCEMDDGRPPRDRPYAAGIDVSQGSGRSNSVISIVDCLTGEKVAEYAVSDMSQQEFARACIGLSRVFGRAKMAWEDQMVVFHKEVLRCHDDVPLWCAKKDAGYGEKVTSKPGFHTDDRSKIDLLKSYEQDLYDRKFLNTSKAAMNETLQYVWVQGMNPRIDHSQALTCPDPTGAGRSHGDRVIADALAAVVLRDESVSDSNPEIGAPWGSPAWGMAIDDVDKKPQWKKKM